MVLNPTLLAKIADSLDEISRGRFLLGLGAGSDKGDNTQFGYPNDHLVSRFEEAVHITHTLLRTGRITYSGRYYRAEECVLQPRCPSLNGPPIMMAATGPRMMRLTARYADIWNCLIMPTSLEPWQPYIDAMEAACADEGRDPATLKKTAGVLVTQMPGVNHPYGESLSGEPEQIARAIQRYFDYGFNEVIIYPAPDSSAAVGLLEPVLAALRG